MVGAEVLGDDAALDADVEAGDLLVDDEARAFLVQRDPGQELSLRLPGLPVLWSNARIKQGDGTQPPSQISPTGPGSVKLCNAMERDLPTPSLPNPTS